jgi:hypothetical protein
MLWLLLPMLGFLARTVLGLLAIMLGAMAVVRVSHSTPGCQLFVLGALAAVVLWIAHQLGGSLWRLLD